MQVLNNNDAKSAFELFYNIFDINYDHSFPIKSKPLTYKDILKPWIDDIAIKRIEIRRNLKKLVKKKVIKKEIYKKFKNKVTNELNLAKEIYVEYQF